MSHSIYGGFPPLEGGDPDAALPPQTAALLIGALAPEQIQQLFELVGGIPFQDLMTAHPAPHLAAELPASPASVDESEDDEEEPPAPPALPDGTVGMNEWQERLYFQYPHCLEWIDRAVDWALDWKLFTEDDLASADPEVCVLLPRLIAYAPVFLHRQKHPELVRGYPTFPYQGDYHPDLFRQLWETPFESIRQAFQRRQEGNPNYSQLFSLLDTLSQTHRERDNALIQLGTQPERRALFHRLSRQDLATTPADTLEVDLQEAMAKEMPAEAERIVRHILTQQTSLADYQSPFLFFVKRGLYEGAEPLLSVLPQEERPRLLLEALIHGCAYREDPHAARWLEKLAPLATRERLDLFRSKYLDLCAETYCAPTLTAWDAHPALAAISADVPAADFARRGVWGGSSALYRRALAHPIPYQIPLQDAYTLIQQWEQSVFDPDGATVAHEVEEMLRAILAHKTQWIATQWTRQELCLLVTALLETEGIPVEFVSNFLAEIPNDPRQSPPPFDHWIATILNSIVFKDGGIDYLALLLNSHLKDYCSEETALQCLSSLIAHEQLEEIGRDPLTELLVDLANVPSFSAAPWRKKAAECRNAIEREEFTIASFLLLRCPDQPDMDDPAFAPLVVDTLKLGVADIDTDDGLIEELIDLSSTLPDGILPNALYMQLLDRVTLFEAAEDQLSSVQALLRHNRQTPILRRIALALLSPPAPASVATALMDAKAPLQLTPTDRQRLYQRALIDDDKEREPLFRRWIDGQASARAIALHVARAGELPALQHLLSPSLPGRLLAPDDLRYLAADGGVARRPAIRRYLEELPAFRRASSEESAPRPKRRRAH